MNPRKLSTKDLERFGGASRAARRSSDFGSGGLISEIDEPMMGTVDGNSSASTSGLVAFDPSREPVDDEHCEMTNGESKKQSGLGASGTTPTGSTVVTQSNASGGGSLS